MKPAHILALPVLIALLAACTANKKVDLAIQKYQAGNYPEALDELRSAEDEEGGMNDRWYVRYLAYRGLAHLRAFRADGRPEDREAAGTYLTKAIRRYESGNRTYLSVHEERELHVALESVKEAAAESRAKAKRKK